MREAAGLMVNYLYDLRFIEQNHETFANSGTVIASDEVNGLLRTFAPAF
jgi:malonyl-CoA decarboxylase